MRTVELIRIPRVSPWAILFASLREARPRAILREESVTCAHQINFHAWTVRFMGARRLFRKAISQALSDAEIYTQSASAISFKIASAASAGSGAWVIGRPTTR